MKLLDLFSGAGGAAMGYARAGFEVTGVDHKPQKNYPFTFIQGDALDYCREHGHEYDAIHASPPCQRYANVTRWRGKPSAHPDLLPATRDCLMAIGRPWVIENVPGAPLRADLVLCGSQFGLPIKRHRWFETSWHHFTLRSACACDGALPFEHKAERAYADAMGCDWMSKTEAREAIPPAYSKFIGDLLMAAMLEADHEA